MKRKPWVSMKDFVPDAEGYYWVWTSDRECFVEYWYGTWCCGMDVEFWYPERLEKPLQPKGS